MPAELEDARRAFAERLQQAIGLRSAALVRAFATVPREHYLGLGPWKILVPPDMWTYRDTPDADPRHLCANVLVAIDASRHLNNGEPAALARWLDTLALAPRDHFLHLGCGVGYYTAIAAEVVSARGNVLGLDIDAGLVERARRNLSGYPHVAVACGDGSALESDAFDAIFVNAGATHVPRAWTEALRPGGRLLVPLTVGVQGVAAGVGQMLLITRHPHGFAARFTSPVGIFHCAGARNQAAEAQLRQAWGRGDHEAVRSLRCAPHPEDADCWLHAAGFCLSRTSAG